MANVQHPGFAPVCNIGGGFVTYRRGRVLTNNSTIIALNDALKMASTGDYLVASATNTAIASVSGGVSYLDANSQRTGGKHLPAATLYTSSGVDPYNASYVFMVEDMVNTKFRASVDEAIALLDLNINYQMVLGASANGISGHELDAPSRDTTATLPWRVSEFVFAADIDPAAADAHVFCFANAGMMTPALEVGGSIGT